MVLNKDGSFQRTARFRGPDLDSAIAAELVAVAGRLNNAFRRLGSDWAIFIEAQRLEAATYPDSTIRRQWFAKRKSIAAILKEVMTSEPSALVDTDAANKAADADMALQELGADMAGMGYVTATITVWDADARIADEKLHLVEKLVQGRDFTAMIETVNAVDAWLSSPDIPMRMSASRRSAR